jgi:pimeloyl-ACP methyl ester carboxylesterase
LAQTLAAVQKPIAAEAFGVALNIDPAWKSTPSWYLVCSEDRAITPELQRHMAKRIGASVVEIKASHVPFLSQPEAVTNLIETAAAAVAQTQK